MSVDVTRLTPGMEVVSSAGEVIGRVKEVRTNDFLLDIPMHRDRFVPFSAVRELGGHSVVLGILRDELGEQDWEPAPLMGAPATSDSTAERSDVVVGTGDPAERGTWSASSDAYDLAPLDTRAGRLATSGTDDGEQPLAGALPPADGTAGSAQTQAGPVSDAERIRDSLG